MSSPKIDYPTMHSTQLELQDFVNAVAKVTMQSILVADGKSIRKTCLECIHFHQVGEVCKLVNLRPPAKTIAYGCKSFVWEDSIPF